VTSFLYKTMSSRFAVFAPRLRQLVFVDDVRLHNKDFRRVYWRLHGFRWPAISMQRLSLLQMLLS